MKISFFDKPNSVIPLSAKKNKALKRAFLFPRMLKVNFQKQARKKMKGTKRRLYFI
jgi:hypothetical protein